MTRTSQSAPTVNHSNTLMRVVQPFLLPLAVVATIASPAWPGLTVSREQELNYGRTMAVIRSVPTPARERLSQAYEQAHHAMRRNDRSEYRRSMGEVQAALGALPVEEARSIESFISTLSRPHQPKAGTTCSVTCANGSCSGTGTCSCIAGNPYCTDAGAPGLGGLASALVPLGIFVIGSGLLMRRPRSGSQGEGPTRESA